MIATVKFAKVLPSTQCGDTALRQSEPLHRRCCRRLGCGGTRRRQLRGEFGRFRAQLEQGEKVGRKNKCSPSSKLATCFVFLSDFVAAHRQRALLLACWIAYLLAFRDSSSSLYFSAAGSACFHSCVRPSFAVFFPTSSKFPLTNLRCRRKQAEEMDLN
jgi:hypothetical protein